MIFPVLTVFGRGHGEGPSSAASRDHSQRLLAVRVSSVRTPGFVARMSQYGSGGGFLSAVHSSDAAGVGTTASVAGGATGALSVTFAV